MRTKARKRKRNWCVECLEDRKLLSGAHPAAALPAQVSATGVAASDVMMAQQVASTNNLQAFLSHLAQLQGPTASDYAIEQSLLDDTRNIDLMLHSAAGASGIPLPLDIMGANQALARTVVGASRRPAFNATSQSAVKQSETESIGELQQLTSAQNPGLAAVAQTALPIAQADLADIQQLGTGTSAGVPAPTGPGSSTLSTADVQTLAKSYSISVVEHFLSQLTALKVAFGPVHNYAEKLLTDHEHELVQLGEYAQATGTYVPASVQGQDVYTAGRVVQFANTRYSTRVYLATMVRSHTQDIRSNMQAIATTQNPVLKACAQDDISTDWLHRLRAYEPLRGR